MTTRKTSLLLATTSVAALSMFALGGMGAAPALAQCTGPFPLAGGGVLGTADPDVLTCENVSAVAPGDEVSGLGDGDTITIAGSTVGLVDGGAGNDTITLKAFEANNIARTSLVPEVRGGADNDTITIGSSVVDGAGVFGDGGDDTITVTAFSTVTTISGGDGNDSIALGNGTVQFDLFGDAGDDVVEILGGSVGNSVLGDEGNDRLIMLGGLVAENIEGDQNNDTILVLGGTVGDGGGDDDVLGGSGDDSILVIDAKVFGDIEGDGEGDASDDTIIIGGAAAIGGSVFGDNETDGDVAEDFIAIAGTATIAGGVFGDTGTEFDADGLNDAIGLTGGNIAGDVLGQGGDDTIFQDGANIAGDIQGGLGDDVITLRDGTVTDVWGDAFDGVSQAGNGNDLINLGLPPDIRMPHVQGKIVSGAGNDTVNMLRGTLDGDVLAGSGEDQLFVGGSDAMIGGSVIGESGNDTIDMTAGTVEGSLLGGSDDDALFMGGGSVGGNVDGESQNDLVELTGGVIGGDALGGSGDDIGGVLFDFDFDNLDDGEGVFAGDTNSDDGTLGEDELFFSFWEGAVNADRLPEWERVEIGLFSEVTFTGGTLQTNGNGPIEVFINETSALLVNNDEPGGGDLIIDGNLINEGLIDLSSNDGGTDNVLTVTGDFIAASALKLDTFLNDGKPSITDQLIVEGDTDGETEVTVSGIGGPGGFTGTGPMDGILVVEVLGESEGSFVLTDEAIGNIFAYDLVQADGQNWYLQSSDYLDQAYVYESLPGAIQTIGLALAGQLVERVGVRSGAPSPLTDAAGAPLPGGGPVTSALWLRGVGQWLESEGDLDSTTGASFDQTTGFVQGGGEVVVAESASGRLLIGALAHWGTSSVDVDDASGRERGSSDIDFYGGGLTATWYGAGGLYVDGLVQYTSYDIDISTTSRFSSTSTDGDGFTVSGEVGYRIPISPTAALVPQAQLTWQSIDFDDFVDPDGIRVSLDDGDSLVGRLGLAAEGNWAAGDALVTGYAEANLLHEFMGDNTVLASGTALSQDLGGTSVEFGVGTTVAFNETLSLYGEVDYTIPFDNGVEGLQAVAGLRWSFAPPPAPPAPVVAPVAETAFIVFFDWDRADLTSEANLVLDDVVVVANQSGYASIRLDGYTDLSGSAAYNLGLSERRANSVANGLIARGIAPDEIVIRAFGEENPLVPTPDGVREPQNRRVEIFLS